VKYNSIYNNFSSGELSRYVKGRTDIEEYFKGVEEMTNFIPHKQGGAFFRPGTLVEGAFPSAKSVKDFWFHSFSPVDGKNYLVALRPDDGTDQIIITEMTSGTVCTLTKPSYIWNKHTDFTSSTAAISFSASPEASELAKSLIFVQKGDIFIIVDSTGVLAPIVGARTGDTTFTIDSFIQPSITSANGLITIDPNCKYPLRVPFKDRNISSDARLAPSATTGNITITSTNASAVAISYFTGDVVGMLVRINHTGTTGVARITSKVSDSVVNATVLVSFGSATASTDFDTSSWNPEDGYPRSICFFEGRLFFGGNKKFIDTFWASMTGNIYHFAQRRLEQDATTNTSGLNFFGPVISTDPFSFIPSSKGANAIQWMYPSDTLLVGTTSTEYSISGTNNEALSLTSINVKAISSHGSSKVQPVKVGSAILFVSNDGRRVMEIPKRLVEYTFAAELSSIAEGIIEKGSELNIGSDFGSYLSNYILSMAYQDSESTLWVLVRNSERETNFVLSLAYDKTTKTMGWSKHKFGSGVAIVSTISFACLPEASKNNYTSMYFYNLRGDPNYSLEKLTSGTRKSLLIDGYLTNASLMSLQSIYLDAAKAYDPAIDFTGNALSLSTEHKSIPTDGDLLSVVTPEGYIGDFAFDSASGTITIPNANTYTAPMIVGYKYTGEIKTMSSEAGAQFGVAQGSARRTHEISIYVDRSLGGKYKASNAVSGPFDIIGTKGTISAAYTGEIRLSLNASPDDHQITITQDKPFPFNILWLLTKGYTYDA
jgi:hypothetical protein